MNKQKELLLSGDWNERPQKQGKFSPRWIAEQLHMTMHYNSHSAIDYALSTAHIDHLQVLRGGDSDHNARIFKVYAGGRWYNVLTWNVERDRSRQRTDVMIEFLSHNCNIYDIDFLCLQEAQSYVSRFRREFEYQIFSGNSSHDGSVILVRNGIHATGFENKKMSSNGWRVLTGARHQPAYTPFVTLDGWLRVASIHETTNVDWVNGKPTSGDPAKVRARIQSAKRLVRYGKAWLHK